MQSHCLIGTGECAHVFHWDPHHAVVRGNAFEDEAFRRLDGISEVALKLLADVCQGPSRELIESLMPSQTGPDAARERFMVFVHKLAQTNRSGSPLRADRKSVFESHHLPEGTTASDFHCGVFEGAALALEMMATDIEQRKKGSVAQDEPPEKNEPPEEKNRKVREYLRINPRAKSKDVEKKFGYPEQTVRRMPAWKERPGKRQPGLESKSRKDRPLTPSMLAEIPGKDPNPGAIAAEEERLSILRSSYINTLDDRGRAEFNGLKEPEKLERLGEFLANEGTD
jgi:hypothetical protein